VSQHSVVSVAVYSIFAVCCSVGLTTDIHEHTGKELVVHRVSESIIN